MHRDLSRGQRETTNAVRSMDTHVKRMDCNMGGRFDRLDRKYGEFGNSLKGIGDSMKGMAFDIHAIRLASFPPRRKIGKQVLKQARS